ncbi:calcium-translocating P-type ATPase, SERCA-type [Thermosyntropha sp.]|uniref:calcium-translocating P-type ATPase, SERCA-type n=1 Tax=Thermosyntropha sp. TaxID=2740820 RepID=UPI0025E31159|nr:calcium-translocating P-type ATPase, SERCA-type [Thermosyntropha sp.]MBO8158529.1 calcium-translocating P-type ATPase, SERCA-type [Thermosyntropha sp.]
MKDIFWYRESIEETLNKLGSSRRGLTNVEAKKRQLVYKNKLDTEKPAGLMKILLSQFTDTMVLILLGATLVSCIIGDIADAITIMTIVIINAFLEFFQEYRAEKSLNEIKKLASPYAKVIRDGERQKIPSSELVPGDIVFIEAGDKIPADVRLIEVFSLEVDEAALTGESVPVEKRIEKLEGEVSLAEQSNMAFLGTVATRGRATAVVVATGMDTEMGKIAAMLKEAETPMTPLQLKLDQLGKVLIAICILVCGIVTFLGIYRGEPLLVMFMAGISLAVAAIPEGLPAVVTIVLALGVQRMAKRNAIVRKLPAVETLGCTTVICSDKTGTLTQNKMVVQKIAVYSQVFEDNIKIPAMFKGKSLSSYNPLELLISIAFNCNNSAEEREDNKWTVKGDPTETALFVMAKQVGITPQLLRIREIPFDSLRKKMSVVVVDNGEYFVLVKGALDVLMDSCSYVLKNSQVVKLTEGYKNWFYGEEKKWAKQALRVLGFAYKKITKEEALELSDEELENNLILVGMCGMIDPPRPNVNKSVRQCLNAGIVPVMITGDHPLTASAIAAQIGIGKTGRAITGKEIDKLNDKELYQMAMNDRVFARVSPEHKHRIVHVLKKNNQVVAMTGDGVNDAPAVKAADIGISMGITGTDVTKEASDMILADDDFSTIVKAIYEGRAIYDNIRKFIRYLLGCNIGEVLVMFLASLFALPLPLLPIQILWVNLVTDGLPAMALGLEPPEPDIMKRKPRSKNESIFAHGLGWIIFGRGLYIGIITILVFITGLVFCRLNGMDSLEIPRTMAFTTLVFAQLFYVFECRSEKYSPFELEFFKNRFLVLAVLCSVAMQLSVVYLPALQDVFHTAGLGLWQWVIILVLAGAKFIWRYILYTFRKIFSFK